MNMNNCITQCDHYEDVIIVCRKSSYGKGKYRKNQISRELWCRKCANKLKDRIDEKDIKKYMELTQKITNVEQIKGL